MEMQGSFMVMQGSFMVMQGSSSIPLVVALLAEPLLPVPPHATHCLAQQLAISNLQQEQGSLAGLFCS